MTVKAALATGPQTITQLCALTGKPLSVVRTEVTKLKARGQAVESSVITLAQKGCQ